MNGTRERLWRIVAATFLPMLISATLGGRLVSADQHASAPTAIWSCNLATPVASPGASDAMSGMDMGTPDSDMEMDMSEVEFDQLYIDMMIPHHGSIIALSQAALPRLTDERLIEIAQTVIDTQSAEREELRGYREEFYGDPNPMAMHDGMMSMMMEMMPGMGSMDEMAFQMDAQAQVNAICSAENPDLTFIDQTIPHHEMAIAASETALEQAVHPEIQSFAQRVIDAQQAEIEALEAIRAELTA